MFRLATNEFAVVTRNNVIRTYFSPQQGAQYYVEQLFKEVGQAIARAF
jgi:pyocin large subunit-like protein